MSGPFFMRIWNYTAAALPKRGTSMLTLDTPPKIKIQKKCRTDSVQEDGMTRRLFSVAEYNLMIEAGVFDEDEPIELLDGEIVMMSPIGPRHVSNVNRISKVFFHLIGDDAIVSPQNPFKAGSMSEPQPDLTVLKMREDEYAGSLPTARDVLLIIEVSESSIVRDRAKKLLIYGRNRIPEYWIVNILDGVLEVYRAPGKNGYGEKKIFTRDETISPLAFPKMKIPVKDLLLPAGKK